MRRYIALIGDIEQSKKLEREMRIKTQETLLSLFNRLNSKGDSLISPYTLTLGDEFQTVYSKGDDLFRHIWMIMASVHPVMVRFSIGAGDITTNINRKSSLGMDGPAFHRARDGMDQLKKTKGLICLNSGDEQINHLINNIFRFIEGNIRSWKKNRLLILHKLREGNEVKQIAGELDLSEVAVYKNINTGNLEALIDLEKSITRLINETIKQ